MREIPHPMRVGLAMHRPVVADERLSQVGVGVHTLTVVVSFALAATLHRVLPVPVRLRCGGVRRWPASPGIAVGALGGRCLDHAPLWIVATCYTVFGMVGFLLVGHGPRLLGDTVMGVLVALGMVLESPRVDGPQFSVEDIGT